MQLISEQSGYAHVTYCVRLEDHEVDYPEKRLVTQADRNLILSDSDWSKIEAGEHPHHFGGRVQHFDDGILGQCAHIKVYTD